MADVVAILLWYMLLPLCVVIRLFCKVADVIAFMYVVDGKTTRYLYVILADVIAMVADGITTQGGLNLADVKAIVADGNNICHKLWQ